MRKNIQQLLQECMEGYDAGLTPEECLSAYPDVRAELEPLFRQAISLRVAFAASPREEFRLQAREKLMFAAGRDVSRALSAEPDPEFVNTTRQRLLNRAGAGAQEALRDVPPPRLPFWANARRHLLEAAAAAPPKPRQRMSGGLRSAVSAAVVVVAVGIAGAGFFLQDSPANTPERSAFSTELNDITRDLQTLEQLNASGEAVSAILLGELAARTSRLAEQYSEASPNSDLKEKLPGLIQRQETLLAEGDTETLAEAQQRLDEANQRVSQAAAEDSPEPEPTETPDTSVAVAPTPEPTTEPTAEPTATEATVVPTVEMITSDELGPRELVVQYDADETALDLRWSRITTSTLTFVMPESWELMNVEPDEDGFASLTADAIFIQTDIDDMVLIIATENGEVNTVANGVQHTLRIEGPDGTVQSADSLAQITGLADNWASLFHMLNSIELEELEATATPENTATATATPSPTPDEDDANDE